MKTSYCRIAPVLSCIVLFFAGCSGDNGGSQVQQGDTQGKILAMIASSTAPDSDGDYLPDDVESYLGTKPQDRDSDHDGIPDFAEIFGTGTLNQAALIPDADRDKAINWTGKRKIRRNWMPGTVITSMLRGHKA